MPRTAAPPDVAAAPVSARPLTRSIGVAGGTLLTLSCVTPASSLFVLVPPLFADLGTGTALAIALAVLLRVGIALCYSELGSSSWCPRSSRSASPATSAPSPTSARRSRVRS